jgi:energy-coupling factor transport system ATP-binding protein
MSELILDRVTYTYPGGARPALAEVSLRVEPGEFVVLAGGSGSGKSTLLRAAAGLVPHFHGGEFAGRLVAGGLDSHEHGPAALSAVAGSLFQDPETQVVMGTVRAELAFPLENRGWGVAAVARGVEEAALALGVAALLDRSTHELSGGELQRVALGAALAGRPRLLLLDEPTSQLDPVAGDELLGVLRRVNEEWGTAVVLAEHRLERCLAAADRVIALEDGAVTIDADPRGFLEQAPPALQTPGARLFAAAGLTPPPVAVKDARAALRARGLGGAQGTPSVPAAADGLPARADSLSAPAHGRLSTSPRARLRRRSKTPPALAFRGVWLETPRGPAVLRGVDLAVAPGERVALMGRNGAGKSTLLRLAAGLSEPTRGRVERSGRVSLLLQNPGDYLVAERVGEELPAAALESAGLAALADRHPRDLSGGERQRLALAIVLQGEPPAVVGLDEPTRGMDRARKHALAAHLRELAERGVAVLVATHDAEFAAEWAERTVLLGDGAPVADGPIAEVLGGGWYFATQTARILGGCALLPEDGAALLRAAAAQPSAAEREEVAG